VVSLLLTVFPILNLPITAVRPKTPILIMSGKYKPIYGDFVKTGYVFSVKYATVKPAYYGTLLTLPPNLRAVPDLSFGIWCSVSISKFSSHF
jgi:hypothetical protein